ncbi:nucleotide sugar dehydrogenase [Candidatus Bathyarchaeota archaeon]|nr:nucleotide sugar dehydrogenase [Candidatus Bathyarchaeota archaeon]
MPSPMLQAKSGEIDTVEKRRKYTVGIVGCGQNGILHAYLFARAGFKVKCADANQTVVDGIVRGRISFLPREIEQKLKNYVKTGILEATIDVKTAVAQSDIIVIAIPVEIDEKKKANYSNLEATCKLVGSNLRCGSLVIIVDTVGVGITQGLVKETLQNTSGFKVGADFGLAYCPARFPDTQSFETFPNQERIVAAADENSLSAASLFSEAIAKNTKKTHNIKTAEAVALFQAVQQDVNVALARELALFCEKAGLDYIEVKKLAKDDVYSTFLSLPLGDDTYKEPYLLLEDAENLNLKFRTPAIAREINEDISKHAVNLVNNALKNCGKTLRRARISLLGISQMPNVQSAPKKMVEELTRMLEAKGAKVSLYDPHLQSDALTEMKSRFRKGLTETLEGADCLLILTGHEQFKRLNLKRLKVTVRMPAAIVDFVGIVEPDKVEREGFVFRGLGRGVWKN